MIGYLVNRQQRDKSEDETVKSNQRPGSRKSVFSTTELKEWPILITNNSNLVKTSTEHEYYESVKNICNYPKTINNNVVQDDVRNVDNVTDHQHVYWAKSKIKD